MCYWREVSKYAVVSHLTKINNPSSLPHLGLRLIEHEKGICLLIFRVAFMNLCFFVQMRGTSVSLECTTWAMDWQVGGTDPISGMPPGLLCDLVEITYTFPFPQRQENSWNIYHCLQGHSQFLATGLITGRSCVTCQRNQAVS